MGRSEDQFVGTWLATASRVVCILKITRVPWEGGGDGNISRYRLGKNFNSKKRKRGKGENLKIKKRKRKWETEDKIIKLMLKCL